MADKVGMNVVTALEQAAERYLASTSPEVLGVFLTQVGAAGTIRSYDGSELYWRRVQAVMDCFFTADQRAELCRRLLASAELGERPECHGFLASARAERRLQALIEGAKIRRSATAR